MKMLSHNRILIFSLSLILVSACSYAQTEDVKTTNDNQLKTEITQTPPENQNEKNLLQSNQKSSTPNSKELQIEDVNIEVKIPGVSKAEKKVLKPVILQYKDDIPTGVHPRCIAIDFKGDYTKDYTGDDEDFYFPARLRICPVDEYPKVLAEWESPTKFIQDEVRKLNDVLLSKPKRIGTNFPDILNSDAGAEFTVNLNYISFKNGEGFFVMTQYAMEVTVINNEELVYIFEGLTSDKKYYIWGKFPVKSSHLPNDGSDQEKVREIDKGRNAYAKYLINVKKLLKDKSSFTPKLEEIEETVKSLEIK